MNTEQRLKRIRRIHAMVANIIPHAWADDPKVERDELRGLCEALMAIERALGRPRAVIDFSNEHRRNPSL